jgi:Sugar (and other) transporter
VLHFFSQYINKGRYEDAYKSMMRLRHTRLQAARDMFYMNALIELERDVQGNRNLLLDLFRIPRNRRAAQASGLVMFMQQFCGVNVIAYYSTTVFLEAGFSRTKAILVTMGTGLVNWIFAIPALYTSEHLLFKFSTRMTRTYV